MSRNLPIRVTISLVFHDIVWQFITLIINYKEIILDIKYCLSCWWIAPNILKLWKLCRLVWHRVWLICNVKRCFYWTTIFLRKMAEFYLWWFGVTLGSGLSVSEVWTAASVLEDGFCVIIGCWEKLFGCFEDNYENTGRMEMFPMPGESDLVRQLDNGVICD